jgi:hypothetical protein
MISLSIDPATHGTAGTLWSDTRLIAAGYVQNKCKDDNIVRRCAASALAVLAWEPVLRVSASAIELLIVELPQIYMRGANKSKGDPNKNVLPLAMVDAALAALFPDAEVYSYQPHAWKGTTQKPEKAYDSQGREVPYIIKDRVKAILSAAELAVIDWTKSVSHSWDVADAIGVGMHHLGRFERIRTFPRE